MIVCKRVQYSGRVQGVGFRYTAHRIADGFVVTGFVRNLANGDVELVAEGEADEVKRFLDTVASRMADYICDQQVTDVPASGDSGFNIRA
jgi:acylphosphatase